MGNIPFWHVKVWYSFVLWKEVKLKFDTVLFYEKRSNVEKEEVHHGMIEVHVGKHYYIRKFYMGLDTFQKESSLPMR